MHSFLVVIMTSHELPLMENQNVLTLAFFIILSV